MMNNLYTQRREERKRERVPSSVQNVNQAQVRNKSKNHIKQAWSFYLSKADREKLDEIALKHGFIKPSGVANISALLSAWINDEL